MSEDAERDLKWVQDTLAAMKAAREERAEHLQPGQCPGCGSCRLDGRPPLLHEHGCPWTGTVDQFAYFSR